MAQSDDVRVFGIHLIGLTAATAKKLAVTVALIAIVLLVRLAIRALLRHGQSENRTARAAALASNRAGTGRPWPKAPPAQSDPPGQWVNARQYTGRIVRVTNDKIFASPVYNYTPEFPTLWDEIHVPDGATAALCTRDAIICSRSEAASRAQRRRS